MGIEFDLKHAPEYGLFTCESQFVRRIVAKNPGPYTFTGTSTFVVGRGEVCVIDPGPADQAHIASLLEALGNERVSHIAITHTHPDHSPGAKLLSQASGAKTYGYGPHRLFEQICDDLPNSGESPAAAPDEHDGADTLFVPDVTLVHRDTIGNDTWELEAIHTPGHLDNHLCFASTPKAGDPTEPHIFVGDHVMGWSTSVISPPGGNLSQYLASLELMLTYDAQLYYPTHGNPIHGGHEFVRNLIAHRQNRTDTIIERLKIGDRTVSELVSSIYTGLDSKLVIAAGRSVLSHLLMLVESKTVIGELSEFAAQNGATSLGTRSYYRLASS